MGGGGGGGGGASGDMTAEEEAELKAQMEANEREMEEMRKSFEEKLQVVLCFSLTSFLCLLNNNTETNRSISSPSNYVFKRNIRY